MAHAVLHLAAGLAVGAAPMALPVLRAAVRRAPLARPLARMWVVALAVGAWALIPNLASAAGITAALHDARWGDVFVLHRTLDRRVDGGLLIGELALVAQLVGHYLVLLAALVRAPSMAGPRPPA